MDIPNIAPKYWQAASLTSLEEAGHDYQTLFLRSRKQLVHSGILLHFFVMAKACLQEP